MLRSFCLLVLTATLQPASNAPFRYRIDTKIAQDVDATAAGGQHQQSLVDRSIFFQVTFSDSAGGKRMRAVLDSVVTRGAAQAAVQATSDSARGKVVSAFLAADGQVLHLAIAKDAGAIGIAVLGQLADLFPTSNPAVKTGDHWTVSAERTQLVPDGQLAVKRRSAYEAMGDVPRNGVPSARLDLTFATTFTGAQKLAGARAKVEGNSMGSGSAFVSRAGVYLGGMRTEKSERRLTPDGARASVLVTSEASSTIVLLK